MAADSSVLMTEQAAGVLPLKITANAVSALKVSHVFEGS
jgi:hypothetical protein